ncbi:hypothetical protein BGW37DRAFT_471642 [Umbelopsis sp. PMI_123]|nr:hypothetical protein BGW37DRAFT_471642 [Umbelopsis sp. PMI_123]
MKLNALLVGLTMVVCVSRLTSGAPTSYASKIMADEDDVDGDTENIPVPQPPVDVDGDTENIPVPPPPVPQPPIEVNPLFKLTPEQSQMLNGNTQADPLPQPDGVQRIHSVIGKQTY